MMPGYPKPEIVVAAALKSFDLGQRLPYSPSDPFVRFLAESFRRHPLRRMPARFDRRYRLILPRLPSRKRMRHMARQYAKRRFHYIANLTPGYGAGLVNTHADFMSVEGVKQGIYQDQVPEDRSTRAGVAPSPGESEV